LTTSIAAFRALTEAGIQPDLVAGHSLGEYSALVAAGALDLGDATSLVRRRGQYMQEAVPVGVGAMAAILGLAAEKVAEACAAAAQNECCAPANYNSPTQIVIAGHKAAVERAVDECKARGAKKATILNVSAPFHSALMRPAQEMMTRPLGSTTFADLKFPIVNNVDAEIVSDGERARSALIRQISAPVQWTESILKLFGENVGIFIEVGQGKTLTGLVKSIAKEAGKEVKLFNVEDPASLQTTVSTIQSAIQSAIRSGG
jgi:[acyl-carrier-protein] S-malonyltransferase